MQGVEWTTGAELQRDLIRLELSPTRLRRFNKAFEEALEQVVQFNESAPKSPISRMGREDIRRLIFGQGYSLTYIIRPEEILILSILPPGMGQALD